ncbi:MAG: hypothetical protein QHJ73_08045, partial [Armatimonadota bacterium]|nr:hypothetical protein [Armatimonadota bacterium]
MMQRTVRLRFWGWMLLLAGLPPPAEASVRIQGAIRVFNRFSGTYEPARHARVRVVLGEYCDADTFDKETTTNEDGYYRVSKGNAWWRDGYRAEILVFAETPNKLEIQEYWGQIDGYQALSHLFTAKDDKTTTVDLWLDGPQENIRKYQVGGINGV